MSTLDVDAKFNEVRQKYLNYLGYVLSKQRDIQQKYGEIVSRVVSAFSFDSISWAQKTVFDNVLAVERPGFGAPQYKPPSMTLGYSGGVTTYDGKEAPTMPVFVFDPDLYSFQNVETASLVTLGSMFLAVMDKNHPDPADYENVSYKYHKLGFWKTEENITIVVARTIYVTDPTLYDQYIVEGGSQIKNARVISFRKDLSSGTLFLDIISGKATAKAFDPVSGAVSSQGFEWDVLIVALTASQALLQYIKGLRFLHQTCSGSQIYATLVKGVGSGLKLICHELQT